MAAIDGLVHRWLEPVEVRREIGIVGEAPVVRIVEQLVERVDSGVVDDGLGDETGKNGVACHGIEACLGNGRTLRARDLIEASEISCVGHET